MPEVCNASTEECFICLFKYECITMRERENIDYCDGECWLCSALPTCETLERECQGVLFEYPHCEEECPAHGGCILHTKAGMKTPPMKIGNWSEEEGEDVE